MMNLSNYGIVTGRLVKDPAVYTDTENRKVYSLVLQIENIRLDETKSSTHANTAANTGGKKQTRQRSNSRSK